MKANFNLTWAELGGINSMANNATINWSQLGDNGNDNVIYNIFVDKASNVYTCGNFPNTTSYPNFVEMYNGSAWGLVGTINSFYENILNGIWSVCTDNKGDVYAASAFFSGTDAFPTTKFSNAKWNMINSPNGCLYSCNAIRCDSAGNVYAAISLTGVGSYVAKYTGGIWQPLGSITQFNNEIIALHIDGDDNIYVGGRFTNIHGDRYVAKYTAGVWHELTGLNANGAIRAIATDKNGNVYAGGDFYNANEQAYVAKYDASGWKELGHLKANNTIFSICCDGFNGVYAAGMFTNSDGLPYVACCNTNTEIWSQLGSIVNVQTTDQIRSLTIDKDSIHIYAGGTFANSYGNCYVAVYDIAEPA